MVVSLHQRAWQKVLRWWFAALQKAQIYLYDTTVFAIFNPELPTVTPDSLTHRAG
jgi:hypothetical protein